MKVVKKTKKGGLVLYFTYIHLSIHPGYVDSRVRVLVKQGILHLQGFFAADIFEEDAFVCLQWILTQNRCKRGFGWDSTIDCISNLSLI